MTLPRLPKIVVVCSLALICSACADETTAPVTADFEELCGTDGPLQILPLAPNADFTSLRGEVIGDRYLFTIQSRPNDEAFVNDVWSVGRCGEDPVQLADDVDYAVYTFAHYTEQSTEVGFVCDKSDGRLLALDIHGIEPANPVFETRNCKYQSAGSHGLLAILGDGPSGPLVLQPWPDDPLTEAAEPIVLVDDVKINAEPAPHSSWHDEVLGATEQTVFAITSEDKLVAVDLDSFALTVLSTDVREFRVGPSGRYLVWQSTEITNDDPEWPEGPVFLLDRETDEVTPLGSTALAYSGASTFTLESLGLLHYRGARFEDQLPEHWVNLATLESIEVPGELRPVRVIDETRAIFQHYNHSAVAVVVDTATAEVTTIYGGGWAIPHVITPKGLLVLPEQGGELLRIDYSGESQLLAPHVRSRYFVTAADHVITPSAVGSDNSSELVVVDPDTHAEAPIDYDVHIHSTTLYETDDDGPIVSYLVGDSDHYGVWVAKLSD